jgi:hypothetical protein
MSTLLSRAPCPTCRKDELICGLFCRECGTQIGMTLTHEERTRPKPLTDAERKQRWREKNRRRRDELAASVSP